MVIGTLEYRTNVIIEVCLQIGTKTIYETEKKQPSFSRRKKRFLLSIALFHLKHEIKHKPLPERFSSQSTGKINVQLFEHARRKPKAPYTNFDDR